MTLWALCFLIASIIFGISSKAAEIDTPEQGLLAVGFFLSFTFFILTCAVGLINPRGGE